MKIDDTIKEAILKASEREGSQAQLAKAVGVFPASLSRYLNGQIKRINPGTWNLLHPLIKDYLPGEAGEALPSCAVKAHSVELSAELVDAIRIGCDNAGGKSKFARWAGVKRQNIDRYLQKQVKEITPKVLDRLLPFIGDYLSEETRIEIWGLKRKSEDHLINEFFSGWEQLSMSARHRLLSTMYELMSNQVLAKLREER